VAAVVDERVQLTLAATPPMLRVARLAAANVAHRIGFTLDEIEDLKIAVDELCFALVGKRGREGSVTLEYRIDEQELVINGIGRIDGGPTPALTELSRQILDAVADEHRLDVADGTARFLLRKRRAG
jgi:serine/threonine-protein kinase RsbW